MGLEPSGTPLGHPSGGHELLPTGTPTRGLGISIIPPFSHSFGSLAHAALLHARCLRETQVPPFRSPKWRPLAPTLRDPPTMGGLPLVSFHHSVTHVVATGLQPSGTSHSHPSSIHGFAQCLDIAIFPPLGHPGGGCRTSTTLIMEPPKSGHDVCIRPTPQPVAQPPLRRWQL